jgi:alpha-beta hydrolase superfamily lysophospholipase
MKAAWIRVIGLAVVLAGTAPFTVRLVERFMTFHPSRYDASQPWTLPKAAEDVWFAASDGVRLHGWLLRAEERPAKGAVLYFHGNAGYVPTYLPAIEQIRSHGYDVMVWDYRGYGRSEGTPEDEEALYRDGDAAVAALADRLDVLPSSLILYGFSLGSVVATEMASRHGCRALALQAPLASLHTHVGETMPFLPNVFLGYMRNRFDNASKIASVSCPVLVLHGENDRTISVAQGRAVYAAARGPKRLELFPGGGHVLGEEAKWVHIAATVRFVEDMAARMPGPSPVQAKVTEHPP